MRYTNLLDGLEVFASIGIHPGEVATPQRVILSVAITVEYEDAPIADDIASVVNYALIRSGIIGLATGRHFNLQETLCDEVASLCFADPRVRTARVRSVKPDIYPDAAVGCEVERDNPVTRAAPE